MSCHRCNSDRIVTAGGKVSDMFYASYKDREYDGYVASKLGIGSGDYIDFSYCANCGQIQNANKFPLSEDILLPEDLDEEEY